MKRQEFVELYGEEKATWIIEQHNGTARERILVRIKRGETFFLPDGKRKKWLADPISEETALQLLDWGTVHLVEQSRSGKGSQRANWRRFGLCPVREILHEMIGYDC